MKNGHFFLILSEKIYIPSELFIVLNIKISEYNKKIANVGRKFY